jgi:hypothetical protein
MPMGGRGGGGVPHFGRRCKAAPSAATFCGDSRQREGVRAGGPGAAAGQVCAIQCGRRGKTYQAPLSLVSCLSVSLCDIVRRAFSVAHFSGMFLPISSPTRVCLPSLWVSESLNRPLSVCLACPPHSPLLIYPLIESLSLCVSRPQHMRTCCQSPSVLLPHCHLHQICSHPDHWEWHRKLKCTIVGSRSVLTKRVEVIRRGTRDL